MNDYHRAKNVFGELTFGEYWNLVGCHAVAFKVKRSKNFHTKIEVEESCVKLFMQDAFASDGSFFFHKIPFTTRVKAFKNKVVVQNELKQEMVVEFFELKPLEFDSIETE